MSGRFQPQGFPELARGFDYTPRFAAVYRTHSGTLCCWFARSRRGAEDFANGLGQTGLIITESLGTFPCEPSADLPTVSR